MAGGNIVDAVKLTNGTTTVEVDQFSKSLVTIDTEHKKLHDGLGYTFSKNFIVGTGASVEVLLVNPLLNFPHLRIYVVEATGAPSEVCFNKNVTVAVSGDIQAAVNNNLNSSNTPNLAVYLNPDVSNYGTEIDCDFITGSKFGGGTAQPYFVEWILKQDDKYAIIFSNKSGIAVDVNFHLFWYEA